MPETYFELANDDQRDILQTSAAKLGQSAAVLEKDIWVCWVLEALFSMPNAHPMAFKGGTSLSKIYRIIDRFSEDVDITLSYRHFDDVNYSRYPEVFNPFSTDASRTQIGKYRDRLQAYVKAYASNTVVPYFEDKLNSLPSAKSHKITMDEMGEKLWISYPSVVEEADPYLRTEVLIELGGRNVIDPNEIHHITPYVADFTEDVTYPSCDVTVLSPKRTFWEKATLIHVECNREKLKANTERLSRHWYDLVMLHRHESGRSAVNDRALLEDVVRHKKVFFDSRTANYDACLSNQLKLLPEGMLLDGLRADYNEMMKSGMMYQNEVHFDEIIESINRIEHEINNV